MNAYSLQHDDTITNLKNQQRTLVRKMSNTSETRAAIESGDYKLQYAVYVPLSFFSL
jgi:vesicle transport protein SEC22